MRRAVVNHFVFLLIACVFVGCTSKQPIPTQREAINAAALMQIVETLAAPQMEGRDAGTKGIELARDYLVEQFKDAGLKPAFVIDGKPSYRQPFTIRTGKDANDKVVEATVYNVGALLPGSGSLKDEVLIIGGHYDHVGYGDIGSRAKDQRGQIHPGADDNASGTAGVVLLARDFQVRLARAQTDRRTILFTCFAGEERGLLGSRYMTQHPGLWAFDAKQVTGMINMDMIGRLRNDELYIFTDATGKQWRDWIKQANQSVGLDLQWGVRPPGGSDHTLFIAAGIPAVFFNTWLHEDYHTPGDTADKINAQGSVAVLEVVAGLAEHVATARHRITFVPPKPRPPRPYLGAKLGSAKVGVLIEDVLADGPMDKAGVKNGDALISLGQTKVNSPGEVRAFLAKAKAGTEVKAQLKRGGETIKLTILLGIRR